MMKSDTIDRVVALPCFVRRATGLLDPLHKLLLLQLALLSDDGIVVHFDVENARLLRLQTSLPHLRMAGSLRRLESGGFVELYGDFDTDRFDVYLMEVFE